MSTSLLSHAFGLVTPMDMWPAYIDSVIENCMDADIVFDHFHIIKMLNQKLEEPFSESPWSVKRSFGCEQT